MQPSQIYIIIAIIVLLIIGLIIFFIRKDKKQKPLTKLTILAFVFILLGILFTDNQWFSYSMFGIGIVIAIIDIIMKIKKK